MGFRVFSKRNVVFGVTLVIIAAAGVVSGFVAEQRALDAEEAYVAEQLRDEPCLTDRGVNEGAATRRVSITGVTAGGVRVAVSVPYAYTVERNGEPIFADTASDAVYGVTLTSTRRIRGDDIDIC